ncbi:cytochrome c [Deinococcus detaillensis]|uniref:Cytochrome c n=1 Tax=Deinococcus detaillensis TaxID=2592048 RepID=A0A553V2J0_9DEIO|nr:cytochrome c [Deinococcus detaillensis]TSA86693.1 cytochrome c [Deinococcus detaillensis]
MRLPILAAAALLSSAAAASADLKQGQSIYQTNCAACHGAKAQGGLGPKLSGEAANWSAAIFQRALLKNINDNGKMFKAPMPFWGKVGFAGDKGKAPTKTELVALQAYLKTFK